MLAIAARQEHDARFRTQGMQWLLKRGFNHERWRSRLTEGSRELRDPIRLACLTLGTHTSFAIDPALPVSALDQH